MGSTTYFLFLILFILLISASHAGSHNNAPATTTDVRSSCLHATYPDICLRTLSPFSGVATTPLGLAQAAVKVSISWSRSASGFLAGLKSHGKREQEALLGCIAMMRSSTDKLSQTLSELYHLGSGNYAWHMSNVRTWVGGALTFDNDCLDWFQEADGYIRSDVKQNITNVAQVTSNALYFVALLDKPQA